MFLDASLAYTVYVTEVDTIYEYEWVKYQVGY